MKGVPFSLSFIIFVICDFEFQVHLSPLKAWCFSFFLFFFQQFNWLLIRVGHISRWPRRVLIGYSVGLGDPLSCHIISSWSVFVGLIIGGFHSSSSSISFLFQSFHLVNSIQTIISSSDSHVPTRPDWSTYLVLFTIFHLRLCTFFFFSNVLMEQCSDYFFFFLGFLWRIAVGICLWPSLWAFVFFDAFCWFTLF